MLLFSVLLEYRVQIHSYSFTYSGSGGTTIKIIEEVKSCKPLSRFCSPVARQRVFDRELFFQALSYYKACCAVLDYWISKDRFITEEEFRHRLELKDLRASYLEMYLQLFSPEVYSQRYFDSIKHSVWDEIC